MAPFILGMCLLERMGLGFYLLWLNKKFIVEEKLAF
jgi:hypothetical protein